jgi:CHAD domain-containing protein
MVRFAPLREVARNVKVRKREFLKIHARAARTLARDLERFLEDPDEDAVHDARTAIRRVDAHVSLLPKSIRRSPGARELLERHKRVMKSSAKVRDLDIVRGKVSPQVGAAPGLLRAIEDARRRASEEAGEEVAAAAEARVPAATSKEVTQARLQRRFRKVVARLAQRIDGLLPVVAGDPRRLEELHSLRIACKRLRYTLEVARGGDAAEALALMESWQDALGAIRDWDVTLYYLEKAAPPADRELLQRGARERAREFRAFARSVLGPA